MSEVKDPKIKLFGQTIKLPETGAVADAEASPVQSSVATGDDGLNEDPSCFSNSMPEDGNLNGDSEEQESRKSLLTPKDDHSKEEDNQAEPLTSTQFKVSNATTPMDQDSNVPSADSDAVSSVKMPKPEDDQTAPSNSLERTLKKPDKILPCPRCNSMDTKFCYFNNYNVNQPRHFCKNCQRYWTAGGTMRNVPVGAGRRKNKNSASQFRNPTAVPEVLQPARVDLPNGSYHPALSPNGTILTFSSDSPLCESMASVLNSIDKTIRNRNGVCSQEELSISVSQGEDGRLNISSTTAPNSIDETGKPGLPDQLMSSSHPILPQVPCIPGVATWPYPLRWNSPVSPPPTFAPATFPLPFYSSAPPFWGCAVPGVWNVPLVIPSGPSPQQAHTAPTSGPNSPTLGKHSRDDSVLKLDKTKEEELLKETHSEKSLWVPKTLRIDDPEEAAKSSIWATLGIKKDKAESFAGEGLFKPFQRQPKNNDKIHAPETISTVLQANPAALSRSLNFHESS